MAHSFVMYREKHIKIHDGVLECYLMYMVRAFEKSDPEFAALLLEKWRQEVGMSGFMNPDFDALFSGEDKRRRFAEVLLEMRGLKEGDRPGYIAMAGLPVLGDQVVSVEAHRVFIGKMIELMGEAGA